MNLVSFRSRSLSEALRLVRESLGPDASVLHTREVGGALGRWLGSSEIEVTASAEIRVPSRLPQARHEATCPSPLAEELPAPPAELHDFRRKFRADLKRTSGESSVIEQLCRHGPPAGVANFSPNPPTKPENMPDQAAQLRRLALNVGWAPGPDDIPAPRTLVLSGGKEGLGTTTLAVNFAVAMAAHGLRTLLIDADLYRADVAGQCGLPESTGIGDVLAGRKSIHEVLQRGPGGIQMVIGARTPEARNACSEKSLQRILRQIQQLGRHADIVLIDAGSGPSEPTIRFWQAADEAQLVTTPDAVAVMDTYATMKTLLSRSAACRSLRLVVNQAVDADSAADVHRRIDQSCVRFLGMPLDLAGWLPHEAGVPSVARRGQPLLLAQPDSPLSSAIEELAERLLESPQGNAPRQQRLAA